MCRSAGSLGPVPLHDHPIATLEGEPLDAASLRGKAVLVVNVASRCGFTPQYEGLQRIHDQLSERGFSVFGIPCNQFLEQEPGTAEEIRAFCTTSYGVTFPLSEKIEVNGPGRHPIFEELTKTPDAAGEAGDVQWNFEKFVVSPEGVPVARFRTGVDPEDPDLLAAIEAVLPS